MDAKEKIESYESIQERLKELENMAVNSVHEKIIQELSRDIKKLNEF
jgi:predicted nucleic acid-binding OB-fold protein